MWPPFKDKHTTYAISQQQNTNDDSTPGLETRTIITSSVPMAVPVGNGNKLSEQAAMSVKRLAKLQLAQLQATKTLYQHDDRHQRLLVVLLDAVQHCQRADQPQVAACIAPQLMIMFNCIAILASRRQR